MTIAQMLRNRVTSEEHGSDQARAEHHGQVGRRPRARHSHRGLVVEGRPPSTVDVPADDSSTCRYCLAEWAQSDPSATYTFLYRV